MRSAIASLALMAAVSAAEASSGDGFEVCGLNPKGDNFLALRAGPSSDHAMIMKLGPGSVVEARAEPRGNWLQVVVETANGRTYLRDLPTGYVYRKYLCPL